MLHRAAPNLYFMSSGHALVAQSLNRAAKPSPHAFALYLSLCAPPHPHSDGAPGGRGDLDILIASIMPELELQSRKGHLHHHVPLPEGISWFAMHEHLDEKAARPTI